MAQGMDGSVAAEVGPAGLGARGGAKPANGQASAGRAGSQYGQDGAAARVTRSTPVRLAGGRP
eukprot:4679988-Alexandrium_andersonii.AAC.1